MAKEIGPRPRCFSNAGGSALESRMGCFHAVHHECYCIRIGFRVALASCKKNLFFVNVRKWTGGISQFLSATSTTVLYRKKYHMLQVSFSKIAHFERTKTSMIFVFNVWLLWAIYLGIPAAGSKIAGSTVVLMTSLLDLHCHR